MTQQTYIMLTADEGKILTNGETYGRVVALGNGDVPDNWREVDEAEYSEEIAHTEELRKQIRVLEGEVE